MSGRRTGEAWLVAGMLAGLALAVFDLAGGLGDRRPLAAGVAAMVNGREIRRADYDRALAAVAGDRREGAVDAALGRRVLDRLIDEELLVQRGLELGLTERDPSVRSVLVAAVLSLYAARAEDDPGAAAADPGDAELGRFLDENRALFRVPGRLRVRRAWAAGEAAQPGDPPDVLLPMAKLRDYLGEAATAALARLSVGAAWPAPGGGPSWVLVEREAGREPALAEVRGQVLAEHRRQAGDRRLRAMLDERRRAAAIRFADGAGR